MGINISLVFIEGKPDVSYQELVEKLGFSKVEYKGKVLLQEVIFPSTQQEIGVGSFGSCTVIAHGELPLSVIEPDFSRNYYPWDQVVQNHFSINKFIATYLQSTINGYGFAYLENSIRLRQKLGNYQQSPLLEDGEPIEEERAYLANSYINEKGKRIYTKGQQCLTEDQIGEEIVLSLIDRFTGQSSALLSQTAVEKYTVSR